MFSIFHITKVVFFNNFESNIRMTVECGKIRPYLLFSVFTLSPIRRKITIQLFVVWPPLKEKKFPILKVHCWKKKKNIKLRQPNSKSWFMRTLMESSKRIIKYSVLSYKHLFTNNIIWFSLTLVVLVEIHWILYIYIRMCFSFL